MSLGVVFEGMTLVAFLVLLFGGKQKREAGWGVLALLICVAATVQCAAMSLVVRVIREFELGRHSADDKLHRHTSTITTNVSLWAGSSLYRGSCAPLVGACRLSVRQPSVLLLCSCRQKEVTN